jgi:hypothetical protein
MSKNVKQTQVTYTYDNGLKVKNANFKQETLINITFANKITASPTIELSIKGDFLYIVDTQNKHTTLIPLSNISSITIE